MKKFLSIILLVTIFISLLNIPTFAEDEIIMLVSQDSNNKESEYCTLSGTWHLSTNTKVVAGPNGEYTWYSASKSAVAKFDTSHLNGSYGVYTWLTSYGSTAELIDVTVTASGKSKTNTISGYKDTDEIGEWIFLGKYDFNKNENDNVSLNINPNAMSGQIRVSALKFILNDPNLGDIEIQPEKIDLEDGESVILDPSSSGFYKNGRWSESSYKVNNNSTGFYTVTQGSYAMWLFDVGEMDDVEILVPKPASANGNEDSNATFDVCASGKLHTITSNFNEGMPGWLSLGKYDFSGDGNEYVKIRKTSKSGYTRAIGVKLALNDPNAGQLATESILVGNEELHIFERMGMYTENEITDKYMNSKITRAEMAVMLTNLFGKADDVKEENNKNHFADTKGHKHAKTLAWVKTHPEFGLKRQGANSFSPDSYATKTDLIKFILYQLGYNEEWDYTSKGTKYFAETLNIKTDSNEILTPKIMAEILYSAFETPVKNEKYTFFQKVVRENSGIQDDDLLDRIPMTDEMKKTRADFKNKDRGIIYNNDGNDVYVTYDNYPGPFDASGFDGTTINTENFLAKRTTGIANTTVSTLAYCTGVVNSYTHESEETDQRVRDWSYRLKEFTGKDTLETMTEYIHSVDREILWSMRMNDIHDAAYEENELDSWKQANLDKLYARKVDAMFLPYNASRWSLIDYTHTESRQKMYNILKDVISRYDIDGLELDFTRFPNYFRENCFGYAAYPENVERMNEFVRMIRALTEQYSMERGKPMLLTIYVPDSLKFCKYIGLDIETWIKEDLIDLSAIGCHSGFFQTWEESVDEYNAITDKYNLEPLPVYAAIDSLAYSDKTDLYENDCNEAYLAYEAGVKGIYAYNYFGIKHRRYDELHSKESIPKEFLVENYETRRTLYDGSYGKGTEDFVTINK